MIRRSVLALFAVTAIVLGCVVVSTPAGAVIDSATIVPSPNTGDRRNVLNSVSCVTVSSCVAVGFYNNGSVNQTLVEVWNGTDWTVQTSPNSGTSDNYLRSVSCLTASSCVAAGSYLGPRNKTLVLSITGPEPIPTTTTTPTTPTTPSVSSDPVAPAFTG